MLVYSPMTRNVNPPDYELADRVALTTPAQVKAALDFYEAHPSRVDEDIEREARAREEQTSR